MKPFWRQRKKSNLRNFLSMVLQASKRIIAHRLTSHEVLSFQRSTSYDTTDAQMEAIEPFVNEVKMRLSSAQRCGERTLQEVREYSSRFPRAPARRLGFLDWVGLKNFVIADGICRLCSTARGGWKNCVCKAFGRAFALAKTIGKAKKQKSQ